jgi:SAM-dependent methyltransferase
VSDTYADVDGSADAAGAVAWQERVDSWPAVVAYKALAAARLAEAGAGEGRVVDVGCGPGLDVVAAGPGAVGVDRSRVMAATALARGAAVAVADAARLPFPGGAFAGARCDRVLHHVADPVAVVAEMARVTRPGGRVVLADPDQGTLVVEVPGAPPDLVERVVAGRRDLDYRHGTMARRFPAVLLAAGLVEPTVDAVALVLTDPADAFGIRGWPRLWGFDDAEAEAWEEAVDGAAGRGFVYTVTYLVVSAARPLT